MTPSKQTGDSETQPVSDAEGHSTNREEFLALRDQNRIKSQHSNQMNETAISCRRGHCCQIHPEIQTAASGQRVLQAQANERILNRWGVLQKASERISAHLIHRGTRTVAWLEIRLHCPPSSRNRSLFGALEGCHKPANERVQQWRIFILNEYY